MGDANHSTNSLRFVIVHSMSMHIPSRLVVSALRKSAFCSGLPRDVFHDLCRVGTEKQYLPGDSIIRGGGACVGTFFLISGTVDRLIGDGKVVYLGKAAVGEPIGLAATVSGKPYAITAVARTTTRVLFFPKHVMDALLQRHPELWIRVSLALSTGVQQAYLHKMNLCSPLGSTATMGAEDHNH